ncbi:aspartate kinase [Annulohypoxylon truncatum]|uniref:aspartate kinase n=1 Tax=Annulohypoxylon truncatum TaxID=327061 RepID=UPI00200735FB|nr:aspartate kinase [Annulohypoxylon truncatum]KAI1212475.1 aspartate kinase [Annulohypoxylon truncatum]
MVTATASKPWLVQKYGGTSLGKLLDTICTSIIPQYAGANNLIVVCSAFSGTLKASGTTSLLLQCIAYAELGIEAQKRLMDIIDLIKDTHLNLLEAFASSPARVSACGQIFEDTASSIKKECEGLKRFLIAAQIVGELSPRSKDRVISIGEKLASMIVAACLTSTGTLARPLFLDDIVSSAFGSSIHDQVAALERLGPKFYHVLSDQICGRIRECGNSIPIVTGFFGIMPDSLLQTVGRGYSDLCAAMCAVAVGADELQIWKEVDGIFTADPRKVPSARLLSTVTDEEATELTYYGSEVIHPLTMDQIRDAGIPLRLKNVFKPLGHGTIIYPSTISPGPTSPASSLSEDSNNSSPRMTPPLSSFMLKNGYHGAEQERRKPTAVTVKDDILLINVVCNRNTKSQGFLTQVFDRLERNKIPADLVATSERHVSLAVQAPSDASALLRLKEELERFGQVGISPNMSIVTVVGHKMRNMVGVSNEILSSLASEKISIYLISQGASKINISLVVGADDALAAMNAIHSEVLKIPTLREQENRFIPGPWLY